MDGYGHDAATKHVIGGWVSVVPMTFSSSCRGHSSSLGATSPPPPLHNLSRCLRTDSTPPPPPAKQGTTLRHLVQGPPKGCTLRFVGMNLWAVCWFLDVTVRKKFCVDVNKRWCTISDRQDESFVLL